MIPHQSKGVEVTYISVLLIIGISCSLIQICSARARTPLCMPCIGQDCQRKPPTECRFGETRNVCGWRECLKGPGESCGGFSQLRGQCVDGTTCERDNKCYGCYIDQDNIDNCV